MAEAEIAALARRLQSVEDRLEIINLLATYGPLVDSGECHPAAELWVDDGVYDVGGSGQARGRKAIAALYEHDLHQSLIHQGSGHVTTTPRITLDGDTATAIAHSFVLLRGEGEWRVWRASANEWKLVRGPHGWQIVERINRPLDGTEQSHDVLRKAKN